MSGDQAVRPIRKTVPSALVARADAVAVRSNPPVLPSFAVQHSVALAGSPAQQFEALDGQIRLPPGLETASIKRKIEFMAGRLCARDAIRGLSPAQVAAEIPRDAHGLPDWPAGLVGSITHTGGFASAAVALRSDAIGIGIDSECLIGAAVATEIADIVATPQELAAATAPTRLAPNEALVLLFSIKEAVFKCSYPLSRLWFGFLDTEVFDIDMASSSFAVRWLVPVPDDLRSETAMQGRFAFDDAHCHTGIALKPSKGLRVREG